MKRHFALLTVLLLTLVLPTFGAAGPVPLVKPQMQPVGHSITFPVDPSTGQRALPSLSTSTKAFNGSYGNVVGIYLFYAGSAGAEQGEMTIASVGRYLDPRIKGLSKPLCWYFSLLRGEELQHKSFMAVSMNSFR